MSGCGRACMAYAGCGESYLAHRTYVVDLGSCWSYRGGACRLLIDVRLSFAVTRHDIPGFFVLQRPLAEARVHGETRRFG